MWETQKEREKGERWERHEMEKLDIRNRKGRNEKDERDMRRRWRGNGERRETWGGKGEVKRREWGKGEMRKARERYDLTNNKQPLIVEHLSFHSYTYACILIDFKWCANKIFS